MDVLKSKGSLSLRTGEAGESILEGVNTLLLGR